MNVLHFSVDGSVFEYFLMVFLQFEMSSYLIKERQIIPVVLEQYFSMNIKTIERLHKKIAVFHSEPNLILNIFFTL